MNRRRYRQERACFYGNAVRFQSCEHLAITLRPAHEGKVLHRAERIAIRVVDPLRIFEKREQAVAPHVEKVVEYVLVGRRSDSMPGAALGGGEGVREPCTSGM